MRKEKYQKISRKVIIFAGISLALSLHLIVFELITGDRFRPADALSVIRFNQEIKPFNPVSETQPLKMEVLGSPYKFSKYRMMTSLDSEGEIKNNSNNHGEIIFPVAVFRGRVAFANAPVFLEFNSQKFFSATTSDSQGLWSWTNSLFPLEEGRHSLKTYNISPFELTGKRDVFVQECSFEVSQESAKHPAKVMNFNETESGKFKLDEGDVGTRLLKNQTDDLFLFDLAILENKEYHPGDELGLEIALSSFSDGQETTPMNFKYELAAETEDGDPKVVFNSSDQAAVQGSGAFLKKINLKNKMVKGDYIVKVTAETGNDLYVQSARFSVNAEKLIQVGGASLTDDQLGRVLGLDIAVLFLAGIIMAIVIAVEMERLFIHRPLSDSDIKRGGNY